MPAEVVEMESSQNRFDALAVLLLVVLSVVMMFVDARWQWLQPLRSGLAWVTQPVILTATLPSQAGKWFALRLQTDEDTQGALAVLQRENLILRANLQKLESLEAENLRLQRLLAASGPRSESAVLAELVEVSLEPFTHRIITNRGIRAGVYIGQAVIDTEGIMGQVTGVTPFTSAVTLITDPNHAIPVQVRRNGLRAIINGLGTAERVMVPYMTPQSDIKKGDMFVSSGMGGRFPSGYPVAKVTEIVSDPNEPFLEIIAEPVARLDYTKQVLLIRPADDTEVLAVQSDEDSSTPDTFAEDTISEPPVDPAATTAEEPAVAPLVDAVAEPVNQ